MFLKKLFVSHVTQLKTVSECMAAGDDLKQILPFIDQKIEELISLRNRIAGEELGGNLEARVDRSEIPEHPSGNFVVTFAEDKQARYMDEKTCAEVLYSNGYRRVKLGPDVGTIPFRDFEFDILEHHQ